MKLILNQRFLSIILIFITFIFLSIHQKIFACSEDVDHWSPVIETSEGGECDIEIDGHGIVKVKGVENIITIGYKTVYKMNQDEEACPDDYEEILEITICVPGN